MVDSGLNEEDDELALTSVQSQCFILLLSSDFFCT
jgi:hypothetical protein